MEMSRNTRLPKGLNVVFHLFQFLQLSRFSPHLKAAAPVGSRVPMQTRFMVDYEVQIPAAIDTFAEAQVSEALGTKEYVHIRIQQRNGKKSLTTVQGLKKSYSYDKILKDLKKEFYCNGNVVQDKELGKVIQLQGNQRKNVANFLMQAGSAKKDHIKIHDSLKHPSIGGGKILHLDIQVFPS
ncbi:hypothetical protein Cgig2_019559 [Carnegiea gigantea]|uniref:SUI1 domain-containing protein n=1 Tax=Carnegiea gigantea TaxID=171969 RepID=A0A9Q1KHL0_9CARY|nr:hypothetical protein Cgig2_019559 [Carnegiea gigantea]